MNFKRNIKGWMLDIAPSLYFSVHSLKCYRMFRQQFRDFQISMERQIYNGRPITVLSGPFQGLKYYNKIVWGPITPKWLGTYEMELHRVVGEIAAARYSTIIDVGAAEGYYAVGFAFKCPAANVLSYDIDPLARHRQRQLSSLNGVRNLSIRGGANAKTLTEDCQGKTLVISDVEGCEASLLDPAACPALLSADLLVEIHPFENLSADSVMALLRERFARSHEVAVICQADRRAMLDALPAAVPQTLSMDERFKLVDECRGFSQSWLWVKRR